MKIFTYEVWGVPAKGFDPNFTFVRSHFVSPLVLACIRAVISVYCFVTIITAYSWLASHTAVVSLKDVNIDSYTILQQKAAIGLSFSFFTYLTYWSLGFYFLFSSIHTFMYAFRQRTWLHTWPKALQLLHSIYYSTVTSFPFLVTVVFWGTMNSGWPSGHFEQWINISVHGLNSVFAIVEIILSATAAPPILHLSMVCIFLSMYLGLAYLTKYTQGYYVYEWLSPAHGHASIILHVLGYAAAMIAFFFLAGGAIRVRNIVARKKQEKSGEQADVEKSAGESNTSLSEVNVTVPKTSQRTEDSAV
jgi:hypothetical protein